MISRETKYLVIENKNYEKNTIFQNFNLTVLSGKKRN